MSSNYSPAFFASPSAAPAGTPFSSSGGGSPIITMSNSLPNTQFLSGASNVNVGTGALGQFGGYIPTPLNQFNNYADYMNYMPGAERMNAYAEMMLDPAFYQYNTGLSSGLLSDVLNDPSQSVAWGSALNAAGAMLGLGLDSEGNYTWDNQASGAVYRDWLPFAQNMFDWGNQVASWASPVYNLGAQQADKLFGLEQGLIDQGMDPQNALYERIKQQQQDQTRAGLAARGLTMDPYGAGVEADQMSKFNIDWQNAQLQRQLATAQGVSGLAGTGSNILQGAGRTAGEMMGVAGGLGMGGAQLQDMAGKAIAQYGRLPMDTEMGILSNQQDWNERNSQYAQQAAQPYQAAFQNWQTIMNQFLGAQQQSFNQNQTSGFEDPFSMLQLQSDIEMQREQMNMQMEMFKQQQKQQQQGMAMQGASSLMGMMGGK